MLQHRNQNCPEYLLTTASKGQSMIISQIVINYKTWSLLQLALKSLLLDKCYVYEILLLHVCFPDGCCYFQPSVAPCSWTGLEIQLINLQIYWNHDADHCLKRLCIHCGQSTKKYWSLHVGQYQGYIRHFWANINIDQHPSVRTCNWP